MAEANREKEEISALTLQAAVRCKLASVEHARRRHLTLRIERCYRGHLGRVYFEHRQQDRDRRCAYVIVHVMEGVLVSTYMP
jgi:hypothetical protein